MIKNPEFWYKKDILSKLISYLVSPISLIWILISLVKEFLSKPYKAKLKVICIGNLTIGGTGKTPFAISTFLWLTELGYNPVFLTRGYGGEEDGPTEVKGFHTHLNVGDEALLLSKVGITIVAKNRAKGAKFIENHKNNFDVIIMDDGLQNYQLYKDLNVMLVDKESLFGNGFCIPAGPLRETINHGIKKVNSIILTGNNDNITEFNKNLISKVPIFNSKIVLENSTHNNKQKYLAFCGLGNPSKFYRTLEKNKFHIAKTKSFPDHHKYKSIDIENLKKEAQNQNLKLITTEKDYVKITDNDKKSIHVLSIKLDLVKNDKDKFKSLLRDNING